MTDAAIEINERLLPPRAKDFIRIIGWHNTEILMRHFGGLKLWVADKPTPEDKVAKLIGLEAAEQLAVEFGYSSIFIPKYDSIYKQTKYHLVKQYLQQGWTHSKIAKELDYSTRQVANIKRELEESGENTEFDKQLSLFDNI